MCKSIALLSGKGGSGKTTIAISMASLLSKYDIKVLLIDCDMSTNGATYFYENRLIEAKKKYCSFYDLLFSQRKDTIIPIPIAPNFDFIPSVTDINKGTMNSYKYHDNEFVNTYSMLCEKYDVIVFDCQAGYSDVLKLILPNIDTYLVVMEPDGISSTAIRVLYLRIGNLINDKRIYQIFNKATEEEYKIYSKVSGGTVFLNIETVLFDWKIRKAFNEAKTPDIKNTSVTFGKQLWQICSVLFPENSIQLKLKRFERDLILKENAEKERIIKEKIVKLKSKKRSNYRFNKTVLASIPFVFALVFLVIALFVFPDLFSTRAQAIIVPIISLSISFVLALTSFVDYLTEKKETSELFSMYQDELQDLLAKKHAIKREMSNYTKEQV